MAYAAIAIIALIVLIARYRLNPFIVITLVSIGLALMAGMPADTIMGSYEAGVGKTLGQTVLYAILIGIPTAIVAGPLYAKFIVPRIQLPADNPLERQFIEREPRTRLPSFALTMGTLLLPVVLMMIGGWANVLSTPGSGFNQFLLFIGNSVIALLVATLMSFWPLISLIAFGLTYGLSCIL